MLLTEAKRGKSRFKFKKRENYEKSTKIIFMNYFNKK
jgi:hypothetical protein